tara:strand:+ start:58 stop:261 length:204 start_codon:yes stop_codon:yes gene_type:complete
MKKEYNYKLPTNRETLSICSKDALLHQLNKIEKGINELNPNKEDYYSKERELRERISNLIHNVKKYS